MGKRPHSGSAASSPEAKRRKRVTQTLGDPVLFIEHYFRPYDPNWPNDADMPGFAADMVTAASRTRKLVIILPPEFMKTTTVTQGLGLYYTARYTVAGRTLWGMLLSEEEGMASNNLGVIAWHILHNDHLAHDFVDADGNRLLVPDPTERKWNELEIVVKRTGKSKDPTWVAKGLDSKGKMGRRLNRVIGDDVITPQNAWSPTLRQRAIDTWDLAVETRLLEEGQAVICGNFNEVNDLLQTLSLREGYKTFRRPSLHKPGKPWQTANEQQIAKRIQGDDEACIEQWPQVWHFKRLMREMREKPQRFRRIHLLDARAERGDKLQIDWMHKIAPDDTPLRYAAYYIGVDPAPGGEGEDLDFFVVTVGALHQLNMDVVQSFAVRANTPKQVELVGQMHDRWNRVGRGVVKIGGGKVSLDSYFAGALEVGRPDLAPKIEPVPTPGNKLERLEGLGPYAQSGWLRAWHTAWAQRTADQPDQSQELTLEDEWRDFPNGRHDDRLDALWVTIQLARNNPIHGDRVVDIEVMQ